MTYKDMTISQEKEIFVFRIKDFWSAVTHFIGMVVAIIGMPILLIKAASYQASFQKSFQQKHFYYLIDMYQEISILQVNNKFDH